MKTIAQLLAILVLMMTGVHSVTAQDRPDPNKPQGENLEVPEGWEVRLDRPSEEVIIGSNPDSSDIYFVNMTPGWHITTGPAGIFYHPANTASANYSISTELHLFDPGDRNREAFGLFWGGKDLQTEDQSYYYFLIRNTGEFLIKKRMGSETELIQEWTSSDVIKVFNEDTEGSSVQNQMSVTVQEDRITFMINEEEVASISSEGMENEGVFGLRVNHSINLHVSDLALMGE
ncbi:MAG: hypothetical protein CL666_16330 [Balneola sp.]|nr:hypothetical protein [Balneola sp.]|tara:strand:- start:147227 stop:147922 length:696 start_codon:yes stop_codon:yes gene_type:complete